MATVVRINKGEDDDDRAALQVQRNRLIREQGPSQRQQTMGFVNWGSLAGVLGQPHSTMRVPLSKLYEMRRDPMLNFGLAYIKVPLIRAPWYIKCEDAQVAAFVDGALRRIYGSLILAMTSSLDFGYQAIEKRFELDYPSWRYVDPEAVDSEERLAWSNGPIKALVWKEPAMVPPDSVEPKWSAQGEFDGFTYYESNSPQPMNYRRLGAEGTVSVDVDHALWVANEKHSVFGSLWGWPRLSYAARFWWSYWFRWALADRAFERFSDPALMVKYPDDYVIDDSTGEPVDSRAIAMSVGESIRSGATVTIPNQQITQDDGKIVGPAWMIEPLETNTEFSTYQESFNYLDVMKLRSLNVPEQALIEGGSSSKNVADEYGDLFFQGQAVLKEDLDGYINRFMIPQLVKVNFPERKVRAEIVTRGFAATDTALGKQLLQLVGQADITKLPLNVREVMEQAGLPTLSPAAVAKEAEEAAKKAEAEGGGGFQMIEEGAVPGGETPDAQGGNAIDPNAANASINAAGPPPISFADGAFADVDIFGRYVKQRDVINLGPLKRKLRGSQLEEAGLEGEAEEILHVWVQAFADAYQDFAAALEDDDDLALAENAPNEGTPEEIAAAAAAAGKGTGGDGDDEFALAHLIVSKYGDVVAKAFKKAEAKSAPQVAKIVDTAGQQELAKAKLDTDVWNMDNPEVVAWMRDHGAQLVRNVSDTVKKELRHFLAGELSKTQDPKAIAKKVAAHFALWPGWKAMRVARTEAAHAYNQATLMAGMAAGVKEVQASDASGGRNHATDKPCIHRHGRIYKIEDAPYEDFHPNGTLGWRLIPPGVTLADGDDLDLVLADLPGNWKQWLHPRGNPKNKGQFRQTPDVPKASGVPKPTQGTPKPKGAPQQQQFPGQGAPQAPKPGAPAAGGQSKATKPAGTLQPGTRFQHPVTGTRYKVSSTTKTHVVAKRWPDGDSEWIPADVEVRPHPDDVEAGPSGGKVGVEGPPYKASQPKADPLIGRKIGGGTKKGFGGAIPDYNDEALTLGEGAGGSNGARWAKDAEGNRWLVKSYRGNQDRVATELLANAVYRKLGVTVAEAGQIDMDGKPAVTYKALEGKREKLKAPNAEIGKGFMADALVGNWDVIGLEDDNVMWGPDGKPFRVDQGGTFQFRAMGQPKEFGPIPNEVWSMRGIKKDGRPTQATRGMRVTEPEMREQARMIGQKLTDADIDALVDASPFEKEAMRDEVRDALKARAQWMRDFGDGKVNIPRAPEGDAANESLLGGAADFQVRPEESAAFEDFMSDGGAGINEYLRNPEMPDDAEADATIEALDGVLGDARTQSDVTVYRGLDMEGMGQTPDALVGKTLADKGYLVGQTNPKAVGGTRLRITVPRGSHAASAGTLSDKYEPGSVIMRRGSRVKIFAVDALPDGTLILDGALV